MCHRYVRTCVVTKSSHLYKGASAHGTVAAVSPQAAGRLICLRLRASQALPMIACADLRKCLRGDDGGEVQRHDYDDGQEKAVAILNGMI